MTTLNKSFVVEAALAALFAASLVMPSAAQDATPAAGGTTPAPAPTKKAPAKKAAGKVHCFGINTCKGKSECAVEGKSGCNGKNDCKGQGWITLSSAKKCTSKKGTVLPGKAASAPSNPEPTPAPASTPATSSTK